MGKWNDVSGTALAIISLNFSGNTTGIFVSDPIRNVNDSSEFQTETDLVCPAYCLNTDLFVFLKCKHIQVVQGYSKINVVVYEKLLMIVVIIL